MRIEKYGKPILAVRDLEICAPLTWTLVRDGAVGNGAARAGSTRWKRLTDKRASSAKSLFHFDVQGSVAKSTHSGLPCLRYIRQRVTRPLHFWRHLGTFPDKECPPDQRFPPDPPSRLRFGGAGQQFPPGKNPISRASSAPCNTRRSVRMARTCADLAGTGRRRGRSRCRSA